LANGKNEAEQLRTKCRPKSWRQQSLHGRLQPAPAQGLARLSKFLCGKRKPCTEVFSTFAAQLREGKNYNAVKIF
jgi:hypothetical protein